MSGLGLLVVSAAVGRADDSAELKAVVGKALKAANSEKLRSVTAWKLTESTPAPSGIRSVSITWVQYPDRYRRETSRDGKTDLVLVVNGDKGWEKVQDGRVTMLPAAEIESVKRLAKFISYRQLLTLDDPNHKVSLQPERMVGDRAASVVKVAREGDESRVYLLDKETGQLLQREITYKSANGQETTQVMSYLDYRKVDGVPVSHMRKATLGERRGFELRLDELTFADKLADKLFEKPE